MSPLEEHITKIIDAKHRLDDLRKQSPEIAEALRISDVYHGLMQDLREKLDARAPQIVTVPETAYPFWRGPASIGRRATNCEVSEQGAQAASPTASF